MCESCWTNWFVDEHMEADDGGWRPATFHDYQQAVNSPKHRPLVEAIRSVHTPPWGQPNWHGGPAHCELDDWNTDSNVPTTLEQAMPPESWLKATSDPERMRQQAHDSNAPWFTPESPWHLFAHLWNDADEWERACALASFEGWSYPLQMPAVSPKGKT